MSIFAITPRPRPETKTKAELSVNTETEYDWQRQDMMENPEEGVLQVEKKQELPSNYSPSSPLNKMGFSDSMLAKIKAEAQERNECRELQELSSTTRTDTDRPANI